MADAPRDNSHDIPKLYRVILPITDIARAEKFYSKVLATSGVRVTPGRHYFDCDGVILTCYDPRADTDPFDLGPNTDHLYFAVRDLENVFARALDVKAEVLSPIETRPWGERSFYVQDPFGNKLYFVDRNTLFLGTEPFEMPS